MSPAWSRLTVLASLLLLAATAPAETLRFGLFGDTPYSAYERNQLPSMVEAMGEAGLAFAIHDGDIKSGHSPCTDQTFLDIRQVFAAAPLPIIYVPGDNEWTDCFRPACGGYAPEERLARLRQLFFAEDFSLGRRKLALQRQPGRPENQRWEAGGVLFLSLNLPGPDNHVKQEAEAARRGEDNRAWLAEGFRIARDQHLPGILIDIQANPYIELDNAGTPQAGFREFFDQLRGETAAFPGQVVLVHGDTHRVRIDQPLRERNSGRTVSNFTRVETYGSPFMGWVEGRVDSADPAVFHSELRPWPPSPYLQQRP